jgi:hypothetical protein
MNRVQNIVYDLSLTHLKELPTELAVAGMGEILMSQSCQPMQDIEMTQAENYSNEEENFIEIHPIVYQNPSIQHHLIENLINTKTIVNSEERESKITEILLKHNLYSCLPRLLKPLNKTDGQGFIYAYFCDAYPGCFKVGRTRVLPTTRIQNQVKSNNQFYTTKNAFYCPFHMLVEKCIHLELAQVHFEATDCTLQGYTEWFQTDWETLDKKIRGVIKAVEELVLAGLLQ